MDNFLSVGTQAGKPITSVLDQCSLFIVECVHCPFFPSEHRKKSPQIPRFHDPWDPHSKLTGLGFLLNEQKSEPL